MTSEELNRLYRDYRGERYLRERQRWEPWYTRALNEATLQAGVAEARQAALRSLLQQAGWAPGERRLILDIGGDRGQCIPLDCSDGAYVLEANAVEPVTGVQRISSLAELPRPAELVLCLHVLEHLPDPVSFVREFAESGQLAPGCLVVLEVPQERPWLGPGLGSRLYQSWLELLGRWPALAIAVDFPATVARLTVGLVMPPLFMKLHEHVGFFTEESLRHLAEGAGFSVLLTETVEAHSPRRHQGVLVLVAEVAQGDIQTAEATIEQHRRRREERTTPAQGL
ncbi:MAG: class I SAM-dependent methyltransferase [Synechococcus sp. ELA057]